MGLRRFPPSHGGPFAMAYPVTSTLSRSRACWYVAGGPLASAAIALGAASWMSATPEGLAHRVAGLLALLSACVFVATAQPFGTGAGVPSDGARAWSLLRDTRTARSFVALLALDGCALEGLRPRDWDPRLVQLAAQVDAPPAYSLEAATALLRWAIVAVTSMRPADMLTNFKARTRVRHAGSAPMRLPRRRSGSHTSKQTWRLPGSTCRTRAACSPSPVADSLRKPRWPWKTETLKVPAA